jgi:sec-independent protein translocase protein TatA
MFGMGPWELFLIFVAILLLFGAKRLPEIAKGMGKGISEFKKAVKDTSDEIKGSLDEKADTKGNDKAAGTDEKKKNS